MTVCNGPDGPAHEIPDGARKLELTFTVDWGAGDARDSHAKPMVFCSFGCLALWAQDRADAHDGRVVPA